MAGRARSFGHWPQADWRAVIAYARAGETSFFSGMGAVALVVRRSRYAREDAEQAGAAR